MEQNINEQLERLRLQLCRLEGKLNILTEEHPICKKDIHDTIVRIGELAESLKSAHKRIDEFRAEVCWTIGISVTIVGLFSTILTNLLK